MTREKLEGFSAQLLAVDPEDKQAITDVCTEIQNTRSELQEAPACIGETLDLASQALQAVIDNNIKNVSDTLDSIIMAFAISAKYTEIGGDEASSIKELQKAIGELQNIVLPSEGSNEPQGDASEIATVEEEDTQTDATAESTESDDNLWVMSPDTDTELLGEFIEESLDRIVQGESSLLELESNPDDSAQIDEIFRSFHTIKGTAGFLDLNAVQHLAHLAENLLDRARDGEIRIADHYADLSLRSCDMLREMVNDLSGTKPGGQLPKPGDYDRLIADLSDPEGSGLGSTEAAPSQPEPEAATPEPEAVIPEPETQAVEPQNVETPSAEPQSVATPSPKATEAAAKAPEKAPESGKQASGGSEETSIRVSTGRLDNLINMAGELVIAHSMVAQDDLVMDGRSPRLTKNVGHSGKIIRELQDLAMALRMVPLKGTFLKMQRLVRDLGRKANKAVRFVTEGEETEIDRNMVEALNDPLVHMIRNALDHGLENADERAQSGKDPTGTVCLRAYHSAGNVVIELQDDGRGLNREKIIAKALERGAIEPGRELSDREVFGLIFAAGLSTAEKITNISGRGVGMDVVRSSIEKLNGRIEVNSQFGEGTTVTMRLPLTMAISDAMLLGVGSERFLLPVPFISQTFRPEPGSLSTVKGSGTVVSLRGHLLPLFRLHELFDIPDAQADPHQGLVVLIEAEGRTCALLVDGIFGQHQVVIKSLGPMFDEVPGISGGAILGDGRIGLILDALGIINLATDRCNGQFS